MSMFSEGTSVFNFIFISNSVMDRPNSDKWTSLAQFHYIKKYHYKTFFKKHIKISNPGKIIKERERQEDLN